MIAIEVKQKFTYYNIHSKYFSPTGNITCVYGPLCVPVAGAKCENGAVVNMACFIVMHYSSGQLCFCFDLLILDFTVFILLWNWTMAPCTKTKMVRTWSKDQTAVSAKR